MKSLKAKATALCFLTLSSLSIGASAAPTNAQANQRIDDAINTHYASAALDDAERALMGIVSECGGECSTSVVARAWMYVGIVRGSGRDDLAGAQEAFSQAKAADPAIKLDELFATELVKRVFVQAKPAEQLPLMDDIRERAEHDEVSEISCSLKANEVETERPIPISCRTPAADTVILSYRHESNTRWSQVNLTKQGNTWVGVIPCTDTASLGILGYKVQSFAVDGSELDALGTDTDPLEIALVDQTKVAPPAVPGQKPPETCRVEEEEAPVTAGPELLSYGDACTDGAQCQGGLTCSEGKCVADTTCDTDTDCFSGMCDEGVCVSVDTDCEGDDCSRSSKNWFGIQGGIDFSRIGGNQVCGQGADASYSCFDGDSFYNGVPNQNYSGEINNGFKAATTRVMLSFERALSNSLSLEARAGFAFNGGPEAPRSEGGDGSNFFPYHAEGRLKVYFTDVFSDDGRGLNGFTGFLMAGGGLAQVDPQVEVQVAECASGNRPDLTVISAAENRCLQSPNAAAELREVNVVQRQGQGFVTVGLGARYGFGKHFAALANLNTMIMLPSSGVTLSPSLGLSAGF